MTNKEIADLFSELAGLMELHGENEFKTKVYANAYLSLKKLDISLLEQSKEELSKIPVLSKAVVEKLLELQQYQSIKALEDLRKITPEGVIQMFKIKGIGPKKVKVFWKEMGLESLGELLYACKENRLILYKGFGPKIQEDIIKSIEYYQSNQSSFLYAKLNIETNELISQLVELNKNTIIEKTGDIRRKMPVLEKIELIANANNLVYPEGFSITKSTDTLVHGTWHEHYKVEINLCSDSDFAIKLYRTTGGSEAFLKYIDCDENKLYNNEADIFLKQNFVPAECRDLSDYAHFDATSIVNLNDIKGVIHNHSTYSDGMYDLRTMAKECIRLGYEYFVISDHSKTAVYANGLSIERVEMQWREIDQLNIELAPFKIFKSIESDILSDGSLDYPDDILAGFDLVIASIHSNLNMDLEKAMMRLIKAIENPFTDILGHMTGRLLLSRRGYSVDHQKIIDACAANSVSIELNANPVRLDIDWKWIAYAQEKGVLISINPDAHNLKGIQDINYGVDAARKGGLLKSNCLNAMTLEEFVSYLNVKKTSLKKH